MAITTVGRTTIQGVTTVGGFNPATLFAAGEQGVWYDPSDFSTLFQDSAGTTPVTALEQPVGRILDKSGRGNTATQATSANRPVVSARVNLLTYTEQFDNAVWAKTDLGVTQNQILAPDYTLTADLVAEGTANTATLAQSALTGTASVQFVAKIYAKRGNTDWVRIINDDGVGNGGRLWVNLATGAAGTSNNFGTGTVGAVSVTPSINGFYLISIASTNASTTKRIAINSAASDGSATRVNNATYYVWGADLRPTNQGVGLPVYQRVGAAVAGTSTTAGNADYDANGFPVYLRFDGSNDSLATGSVSFTGTANVSVFAGARKQSDVATGIVVQSGYDLTLDFNVFALIAPSANGANSYRFFSRGTAGSSAGTGVFAAAPDTSVLTGLSDVAASFCTLRRNGAVVQTDTNYQGSSAFGNYPLHIGYNSSIAFFNGNLYGLIVRGASSTANQITGAENWLNQKTAAY